MSTLDVDYLRSQGIPFSSFSIVEELDEIMSFPWDTLKEILLVTNYFIGDGYCSDSRQLKELLRGYILPRLNKDQIEFLLKNYAYRKVSDSEFSFRTIAHADGLVHGVVNFYSSPKDWPTCLYEKDYMGIVSSTKLEWDSFVAYLDNYDGRGVVELLHLNLSVMQLMQLRYYCKDSLSHTLIDRALCSFENDDNNYNADDFTSSKIQDYICCKIKMDVCKDIHSHFTHCDNIDGINPYRWKVYELGLLRVHVKKKENHIFEYMRHVEFCQDIIERLPFEEINKHILTKKCHDYFNLRCINIQQAQIIQQVQNINISNVLLDKKLKSNRNAVLIAFFIIAIMVIFL